VSCYAVGGVSAILTTLTPEGFVLASDGLASESSTGKPRATNYRKIFQFEESAEPDLALAYGLCGTPDILCNPLSKLHGDSYKGFVLNLPSLIAGSARQQVWPDGFPESASDYLNEVFGPVCDVLNDAYQAGKLNKLDCSRPVAIAHVVGYFKGKAVEQDIMLSCLENRFGFTNRPRCATWAWGGSYPETVKQCLALDGKIGNVKLRSMASEVSTLEEGTALARAYLAACETGDARSRDDHCKTIGGLIQIATITREDGFKWVDPPRFT
jgi:hypothetical protein